MVGVEGTGETPPRAGRRGIDHRDAGQNPRGIVSSLAVILLAASALAYSHARPRWTDVIQSDVSVLYAYLPATFLYHDLSFRFATDPAADFPGQIPLNWTDGGDPVLKMSCGAAVLWMPFFFLAHAAALRLSLRANGYTWPYHYAISLAAIIYAVAGLVLLRAVLRRHFADGVVALTLVAVFAGTNLFYYTTLESGMTHAYSFFLFALFLRLTVAWHANPNRATTLALGGVLGLVVLVRPSNGVLVLAFLLYRDATPLGWRNKLDLLARHRLLLLAALGTACVVLLPQLAYWKYSTGSWVYYSYRDEGFFFARPRIIDGLFSYRKGLFVYTPILSLAFAGLLLLPRRLREWSWAVVVFTAVDLYVVFCWWCWWYAASFGMRALIEAYAIWAIPMAAMLEWLLSGGRVAVAATLNAIAILVCLNLFQAEQYWRGIIHWDAMTRDAYWSVFLRGHMPANYADLLSPPDYVKAARGEHE
jgi:hypothetical protein